MYGPLQGILAQRLNDVRANGLFKQERLIAVSYTHLTLPTKLL
jgi:hypothetical protein